MIGLERVGPSRLANGSASALVTSSMKMATKKKRQLPIAGFFCKKTKNTEGKLREKIAQIHMIIPILAGPSKDVILTNYNVTDAPT